MNPREQSGLELAEAAQIRRNHKGWTVPSQNGRGRYTVSLDGDSPRCTCPDNEIRGAKCKHIFAVEHTIKRETKPDGTTTVTETLKWSWTSYNQAQTEEKHRFAMLLSALCRGVPEPEQVMGRPRLPLGDMVFCAALKVYCGFSSRRFTTDLRDAHANGLIKSTPHFNSESRYLADPELTDVLKNLVTVSSLPLKAVETDFAIDSSGFNTSTFVRWFNKKYGRETDNREWVKCHLMVGTRTKVVTSVDVSGWTANDTSSFVPLVERTAEHFGIREVAADKAYSSRKNLKAVGRLGGTAFVPFKSNTVPPEGDSAWSRMYGYFMCHRVEFLEHCHKRSNVETAFAAIKGKFGDSLRSKSDVGQINEALCKVLCHNLTILVRVMHELDIEPAFHG
jgi:transposase